MFRFREISLHGWDLWPPLRIPLDRDVVIVTGPNGSGKTTLLDAVRQVLNARRLSSRRRLQHYLRRPDAPALIRAVVSNRGRDERTVPFRRERIQDEEVTLACALVPAGGGAPEKRFAVLPGRVEPAELQRILLDSREWIGPARYSRILASAGVTRSLMGVLAIEQGRTNSLFELTPRDLFRRVLDMLGDRAVLERYREARRRYEDTEAEVGRQAASLAGRQAELQRALREVERLDAWERARDRSAELEARLPAAELQHHLAARTEADTKHRELTTKVRRGETETARLEAERSNAEAAEAGIETRLAAAREAEARAEEAREASAREDAAAARHVVDLEAKAAEAASLPAGDLAELEAEAERRGRLLFAAEEEAKRLRDRRDRLAERIDRLERGLPVWPAAVVETREELTRAGIEHRLLAETVEEVTGERAEAVEAALGDARVALLVDPADEATVIEIARRRRFPGPVHAGPGLARAATHGPLELAAGAPAWLPGWLEDVDLLEGGAWHDARGTWVAGVDARLLGDSGRREALDRARGEAATTGIRLGLAEDDVRTARGKREQADEDLEQERRRRRLIEESAGLDAARERAGELREAAVRARSAWEDAKAAREAVSEERRLASVARARAEDEVSRQARALERDRGGLAHWEEQVRRHDGRIATLTAAVSPALADRARRGELDGPDTVRADLERASAEFTALADPPSPEIREEARHLAANVEELERHVGERRREAEEAKAELAECRRRYLEIVGDALHDYRRRVKALAAVADVAVEMELPRLDDDDRSLDEAEIRVALGFDGKTPLPLGDPSFSGGQQVIGGLVLLMGMAETDGEGFFMLDEPFAHLSLDRVDQVGRFLRGTRSQFILTAPTTLDRAQLDPASLVVALAKKRTGDPHAPVPVVAEAR